MRIAMTFTTAAEVFQQSLIVRTAGVTLPAVANGFMLVGMAINASKQLVLLF